MDAVKLSQDIDVAADDDARLAVPFGTRVLRRRVLLAGRMSGRHLLYAEAVVVPGRTPGSLLNALVSTDEPIGRLLAESRLETFREVLVVDSEPAGRCAQYFGIDEAAELLVRSYRIVVHRRPIVLVTEKFPAEFFRSLPI